MSDTVKRGGLGRANSTRAPRELLEPELVALLDLARDGLPVALKGAFAELEASVRAPPAAPREHVWQAPLFRLLPACVEEATTGAAAIAGWSSVRQAYREAHGLGWLHGWRSAADAHPHAARLHTHLFERWRDTLRAVAPAGTRVSDEVAQSIRCMRWGQRARSAAESSGRWTLSGYCRSVRWEARSRALASECLLQRGRPGQLPAFVRAFDLAVVGLHQLHDAQVGGFAGMPRLLRCSPKTLVDTGESALELACTEARALRWSRFADHCRALLRSRG